MPQLVRKSVEPIANHVGGGRVSALQKLLNAAPWRASTVHKQVQSEFGLWARARVPGLVVISLHDYSFPKKGGESVGVARR
jgi:hypothetical protein